MMTEKKQIRVLIVDDHAGVRRGIRNMLEQFPDIVVEGEASNGKEALKLVQEKNPDIMLLDIEMPVMRGDEVARAMLKMNAATRVLAISSSIDWMSIRKMEQNGAVGYLSKDDLPAVLVDAVRKAAEEKPGWIGLRPKRGGEEASERQTLTQREFRILRLVLEGRGEAQIAAELGLSENVVQTYVEILLSKFEADNLDSLAQSAQRKGIII
jgi:DNA-binding NarL/FixJ family response regulator